MNVGRRGGFGNRKRYLYTKFGGWSFVDPDVLEKRAKKHAKPIENSANFLDDVVDYLQTQEMLAAYAKSERDASIVDPVMFIKRNRAARLAEARYRREIARKEALENTKTEETVGPFEAFRRALCSAFYEKDDE